MESKNFGNGNGNAAATSGNKKNPLIEELGHAKSQHVVIQDAGRGKSQSSVIMMQDNNNNSANAIKSKSVTSQDATRSKSQASAFPTPSSMNNSGNSNNNNASNPLKQTFSQMSVFSNSSTSDESKRINPHDQAYTMKKLEAKRNIDNMAAYSAIIRSGGQLLPEEVIQSERKQSEKIKKDESSSPVAQKAPSPDEIVIVRNLNGNNNTGNGDGAIGNSNSNSSNGNHNASYSNIDVKPKQSVIEQGKLSKQPSVGINESRKESGVDYTKRRTVFTEKSGGSTRTTRDAVKWNDPIFASKKQLAVKQRSAMNVLVARMKSSKTIGDESVLTGLEANMNDLLSGNHPYGRESDYFAIDLDTAQDERDQNQEMHRVSSYMDLNLGSFYEVEENGLDILTDRAGSEDFYNLSKRGEPVNLLSNMKDDFLNRELMSIHADFEERVMYKQRHLLMQKMFLQWKMYKYYKIVEGKSDGQKKKSSVLKKIPVKKESNTKKMFTFHLLEKEPRIQPRLMRKKPASPPPKSKMPSKLIPKASSSAATNPSTSEEDSSRLSTVFSEGYVSDLSRNGTQNIDDISQLKEMNEQKEQEKDLKKNGPGGNIDLSKSDVKSNISISNRKLETNNSSFYSTSGNQELKPKPSWRQRLSGLSAKDQPGAAKKPSTLQAKSKLNEPASGSITSNVNQQSLTIQPPRKKSSLLAAFTRLASPLASSTPSTSATAASASSVAAPAPSSSASGSPGKFW